MALIKLITPGAQDFHEPVVQQVKWSSNGLRGNDLNGFIKRASVQFLDKMASIKFHPGEVPVHLIAVGAEEHYGFNRNGDGFKEAVCKEYHPTFQKYARWYRDHVNKDTAKGRGIIKASAYNGEMKRIELLVALNGTKEAADRNGGLVADEELEKLAKDEDLGVSMACVTDPDYPILTRDHGYVRIEDVSTEDYVWTHTGRWRRVTQLNRRRFTGEVHKFHINGHPFPLELTANHPMWAKVFTGSREASSINAKARRYFTDAADFDAAPATWTEAKDIGVGDRFFHKPVTRYNGYGKIDCQDLAAIMGYYLAEGSFCYNGERACTTQFSCHMDDSAVRRIPQIMSRLYPDITVSIKPHAVSDKGLTVNINSTRFSEFLRSQVGAGCRRKIIAPEIFNADDDIKLAFLGAWLDGDGWLDKKGAHWSTASVNLVLQGRDLLASLGIPASIYKIDHAACATSGKPGSGVEYTLNVAHLETWRLSAHSWKAADYVAPTQLRTKPATLRYCHDGTYAVRIKAVETRYVSDQLTYNFEVEDDESYSAAGLISHNCRVSYDECAGCGNKAKSRSEYCGPDMCKYGGCRDNLAKTFDDGTTLGVYNPDPKFFDISKVFRPADRIAYTLGMAKAATDYASLLKEATDKYGSEHSSAYLAEKLGVTQPLWLLSAGPWADPRFTGQLKVASELITIEDKLAAEKQPSPHDRAFSPEVQPFRTDAPDVRTGPFKLAHVVTALASEKCLLPLDSFIAMLTGDVNVKTAADTAATRLPGVFNRLATDPALETELRTNPYLPGGPMPRRIHQWVVKHAAEWSLDRSNIVQRLQLSTLRHPAPLGQRRPLIKSAAVDSAEALAKQYALYQIGFLHANADSPDAGFMREMVVRSNFVY